ncbi:MAG: universal stress protein [Bacteroidales bacterium]
MQSIRHLNTILVCLDLTEIDHSLIKYANFLSQALETDKIIFMHAIQAYDLPDKSSKKFPDLKSSLSKTIEEEINSIVANNFKKQIKTEVVTKIEDEDASEVIINFIEKENVDLTLIGQKPGEDREGHYGQKIASEAGSDLMFIPEEPELSIKKLLCAIDLSKFSAKAFRRALDIAKATKAELVCQYIFDTSISYFPAATKMTSASMEKQSLKKYRKFAKQFGLQPEEIKCRYEINESMKSQAEKIYQGAEEEKAELIIIGAKGQTSSITSLLGNITENFRRMKKQIPIMVMKNLKDKKKWI